MLRHGDMKRDIDQPGAGQFGEELFLPPCPSARRNAFQSWCVFQRSHDPDRSIRHRRSEEHTSELQSLMRISYAVFCLKTKKKTQQTYDLAPRNHSISAAPQRTSEDGRI